MSVTPAAPLFHSRRVWPAQTGIVGLGYLCSGAAMLAFFAVASRALTPTGLAEVAVTWTVIVLAGGCLLVPVEREVARRTAAAQAHSARFAALVAALTGVAAAVIAAAATRTGIMSALGVGASVAIGTTATAVGRGTLAGHQRLRAAALITTSEGALRLLLIAALSAAGAATPTTVTLALAAAALLTGAAAVTAAHGQTPRAAVVRPDAPRLLPVLVAASVISQLTLNSPVLIAKWTGATAVTVSTIAIVLMIGRVPLYLFQAVQTTLLPHLTRLTQADEQHQARTDTNRVAAACALTGTIATITATALGPPLISTLYGPTYRPTPVLFTLIGIAATAALIALTLGQHQQAQRHHTTVLLAWTAAATTGIVAAMLPITSELRALGAPTTACLTAAAILTTAGRTRSFQERHQRPLERAPDLH